MIAAGTATWFALLTAQEVVKGLKVFKELTASITAAINNKTHPPEPDDATRQFAEGLSRHPAFLLSIEAALRRLAKLSPLFAWLDKALDWLKPRTK